MIKKKIPRVLRRTWLLVVLIVVVTTAIYIASAALGSNLRPHKDVYFDYLAEAFFHGRLDLSNPPVDYDLTRYAGKWYVPFLPMPSILMVPLIALFGPNNGLEVPFSAFVGALNVALVFLLMQAMSRRGWIQLRTKSILWLTVLFALGTVHWYIATAGQVWFLSQVVSVTFLALSLLLAVKDAHPIMVGIGLGLLLWTRPHLIFIFPFVTVALFSGHRSRNTVIQFAGLLVPVVSSVATLVWYNWARFDNPFDFGYLTENVNSKLLPDLQAYGLFNPHFLGRNLHWALGNLPHFDTQFPFFTPDQSGQGMSLLVATPALFYMLRRPPKDLWMGSAWLVILLLNVPLLLYYNTGWIQFGYRFGLDYLVLAILVIAGNARQKVSLALVLLILLSIFMNWRGVYWWFYERPRV